MEPDAALAGQPDAPGRGTVWAAFLASVALPLAYPAAAALGRFFSQPRRPPHEAAPLLEALPMMVVATVAATWVYVFGSLIGSFLNVVVYRLPRGQSVVTGGSHCPRCTSPIKWHDNLPIVGWLMLDGRCRSCGLPIATRYPLVESACAGLYLAVYFLELVSGGMNIPLRAPDWQHSAPLLLDPRLDLVALCCYHAFALSVLLVWGLIALDGQRLPARSVLAACGVAAALPMLLPALHPLPVLGGSAAPAAAADRLTRGLAVSAAGGLTGLLVGLLMERLLGALVRGDAAGRAGAPLAQPRFLAAGLAFVGIVFGWQGALGTTALLALVCLGHVMLWSSLARWPTLPPALLLVAAAFVHLAAWRLLLTRFGQWWPGTAATPACLVAPGAAVIVLAAALMAITPPPRRNFLP